jgi:hypothetical protein
VGGCEWCGWSGLQVGARDGLAPLNSGRSCGQAEGVCRRVCREWVWVCVGRDEVCALSSVTCTLLPCQQDKTSNMCYDCNAWWC